jgi:predicted nucleic acid-binding protein
VTLLLLDTSAWARLGAPQLSRTRREEVAEWIAEGSLTTCLPFLLEAGSSARSGADHAELMRRLGALPRIEVDAEVERLALMAQAELAAAGHHRVPPTDLVIAACAHSAGAGVLHYDRDFDRVAERTSLRFRSVWLADAGTIS